jgi:hypothetical protein
MLSNLNPRYFFIFSPFQPIYIALFFLLFVIFFSQAVLFRTLLSELASLYFAVACLSKGYSKIVTTWLWLLVLRSILCFLWIFLVILTTVFLLRLRISTLLYHFVLLRYNNSWNMILLIFGFLMLGLTYTLIAF